MSNDHSERWCHACGQIIRDRTHVALTKRQAEIVRFLWAYFSEHGYSPSFEEIAIRFGYASRATVHEHLTNLERKGLIARVFNEARAIELRADLIPDALRTADVRFPA